MYFHAILEIYDLHQVINLVFSLPCLHDRYPLHINISNTNRCIAMKFAEDSIIDYSDCTVFPQAAPSV